LFTVSEQRVEKACLELATFVRMLDDDENIADYLRQTGGHSFGRVMKKDQPDEPLYLRDLTNKIIHAHPTRIALYPLMQPTGQKGPAAD
jgi:hypothetical protein